jgi:hypothetical protein
MYIYIYILFSFPLVRFIFNFFTNLVFWNHAGGRLRHAFIGIGFRERAEAYDFQAALHDHMKYVKTHKCIMYLFNTRITPHRFFVIWAVNAFSVFSYRDSIPTCIKLINVGILLCCLLKISGQEENCGRDGAAFSNNFLGGLQFKRRGNYCTPNKKCKLFCILISQMCIDTLCILMSVMKFTLSGMTET